MMKQVKKQIALICAVIMLLSLAACGQKAPTDSSEATDATLATTATSATEATKATEATEATEATVATEATDPAPTEGKSSEGSSSDSQQPTSTPKPPVPTYTPVQLVGAVPESARASSSYFDDAVFVGDSVSLKLSYYEAAVDLLGKAQFLTSGSLGSGNALWDIKPESVHPSYQGSKMLIEDAIAQMGAGKVYIMLGMNDIALYGIDASVANMVTLIGRIRSKSPHIAVYVQSMTPLTSTSNLLSSSGHNPANIQTYNEKLLAACQSNGWAFVDVASVMYDSNGYLKRDYCSDPDDMGIHFTNAGCAAWIDYLYTHTAG